MHRHWCRLISVAAGALLAMPIVHAGAAPAPQTIEGLGSISFATSTRSAEAQTAFLRGLLKLHLFEYDAAAEDFVQAQRLDPGFAMAYWGEAMTYNHGIWNERDADAGRTALRKFADSAAARERRAPTPRERAYMAAVDILYAEGATKQETDSHYADAMHALAQAWPDDNNARLFDSLALMGRSEGVRDAANYARAGVIARHAFGVNPHNPGAAHYWIHAMDDPAHAAGALEAAYALSKIAPDAAHAQHMTSHIFMALGMWDEVARANEAAMRVVDFDMRRLQQPRRACGHYPFWLEYAYFQQGRYRAAMQVLDACKDSLAPTLARAKSQAGQDATTTSHAAHSTIKRLTASMTEMRAAAMIDSREWNGAATRIVVDTSGLCSTAAWNDFALGYAAAERGDLAAAQAALDNIVQQRAGAGACADAAPQAASYIEIMGDSLAGVLAIERGETAAGLARLRRGAARYDGLAFDFGPPVPVKPPHELLGEQLLAQGDAHGAESAFRNALKTAPRRALSLLGLARAQAAAGASAAAAGSYRELLAVWHDADADVAGLAEARSYVATHAPGG